MKEQKAGKKITAKAKSEWIDKLKKNTGQTTNGTDFLIPEETLEKALGPYWYQVLKEAERVGAINVLAITSKSLRKTAVVKFIQHYLLAKHEWLNTMDLRRTKDLSSSVLIQSHIDAMSYWATEYGVPWLREVIQQAAYQMYFVRDKKRKDNQELEFSSFDAMRKVGGFTKPYIFHWEELVDPDSKGSAPDKDAFFYTYNLVKGKNRENFLAKSKMRVYNTTPTHWFTMNRWDTDHPLIQFAETHAPWEQVKTWMLDDPENNNFFMHYVEKAEEGWESLNKTLIVYGSKLANHLMVQDEDWKSEQLALIESKDPQALGTVLGDVFEGTATSLNAYHYTRKDTVTREEFIKHYSKHVTKAYISVDLDFSRQIRIRPKYAVSKSADVFGNKIHRLVRDRAYAIKCGGVSKDGALTEMYFKQTKAMMEKICKQIREEMPHLSRVFILFDDKKAQWVGRFNFGDAKNPFWSANKVTFDQIWKIKERPKTMDEAQDTGFMVDIEHATNENLHKYLKRIIINESKVSKQRLEKDRDEMVDDMNADEYPLFLEKGKMAMNNKTTRVLGGNNVWTRSDN